MKRAVKSNNKKINSMTKEELSNFIKKLADNNQRNSSVYMAAVKRSENS